MLQDESVQEYQEVDPMIWESLDRIENNTQKINAKVTNLRRVVESWFQIDDRALVIGKIEETQKKNRRRMIWTYMLMHVATIFIYLIILFF